jgi:hypothetical protein
MTREVVFVLRVLAIVLFVIAAVAPPGKVRCEWLAFACLVMSVL